MKTPLQATPGKRIERENALPGTDSFRTVRILGLPVQAILFLLLTIAIALLWSHVQLMWTDESYVFEGDAFGSLASVLHYQRTTPTSLDPFVYHLFAHLASDVFGAGAFAIRLPSLFGYLLMQICLFYFVRRVAGEWAGVFALGFPVLLGVFEYSVQARPYGLLLGWFALAMVCWQTAIHRTSYSRRTGIVSLVMLAIAIALAINTQYYGVLLLVPLCGAELVRCLERRRLDLPVVLAIAAGIAGMVFVLPFMKAAAEFRAHYYESGHVGYHFITHFYLWLFITGYVYRETWQHIIGAVVLLIAVLLLWGLWKRRSDAAIALPKAEVVFLVLLAALPFFGFLMARLATGVVEGRYVVPAVIGVTALLSICLGLVVRPRWAQRTLLLGLFIGVLGMGLVRIREQQASARSSITQMTLRPEVKAKLEAMPGQPIYMINPAYFQLISTYAPDLDLRSRVRLVYSSKEEMALGKSDYITRTVLHLEPVLPGKIVSFDALAQESGEQTFLLFHVPWVDWTDLALARAHAQVQPLGPGFFHGELKEVRFRP
jgi:hypothetical protein